MDILFKYRKNKEGLIAVCSKKNKSFIVDGYKLDALFDILNEEKIVSIKENHNKVIIRTINYYIVIEDGSRFFTDKSNSVFINKLLNYSVVQNIINSKLAADILRRESLSVSREEKIKYARCNGIKKGASITLFGVSFVIILSLLYNAYSEKNIDNRARENPKLPIGDDYSYVKDYITVYLDVKNNPVNYDSIGDNYKNTLKRYANLYGFDYRILYSIFIHNNMSDNGKNGLIKSYSSYLNDGVAAYNFKTNTYELYAVTNERLTNVDSYFRIVSMIFQKNLRDCDYNFVAALQSMATGEDNFRKIIIQYGKNKYGNSKSDDEYFKMVLDDYTDFKWLDYFQDENGYIYAYEVLSNLPIGGTLEFKKVNVDESTININYRIQSSYYSYGSKIIG